MVQKAKMVRNSCHIRKETLQLVDKDKDGNPLPSHRSVRSIEAIVVVVVVVVVGGGGGGCVGDTASIFGDDKEQHQPLPVSMGLQK